MAQLEKIQEFSRNPVLPDAKTQNKTREEIAIMELELISHHFHMGLSHFLKNF